MKSSAREDHQVWAPAPASSQGSRPWPGLCVSFFVLFVLAGCATDDPGISPPRDSFYFPTGLALDPQRPFLYVTNSNADLRYNGGTITALDISSLPEDLTQVRQAVTGGQLSCQPAPNDNTVWQCPEGQFLRPEATIRIGDYPADLRVSSDGSRLFTPERSGGDLLWVEIADLASGGVDLRCDSDLDSGCGSAGEQNCKVWDCAGRHLVSYAPTRQEDLPAEPFGIYLNELVAVHVAADGTRQTCRDGVSNVSCTCPVGGECETEGQRDCCWPAPQEDHLYLSHLRGGEVSFFTSTSAGVEMKDTRGGFFASSGSVVGGHTLAARTPGDPESLVYVSSRENSALASFVVGPQQELVDSSRAVVGAVSPGTDVRGIAFGPGGNRLYAVDLAPPTLVALDMTTVDNGLPLQEPLWAAEICSGAGQVKLVQNIHDAQDPYAQLAYVVCFGAGEIYVVDTQTGKLLDRITTGQGPNAFEVDHQRQWGLVTNFLDNTIGIIDLDPASPYYHKMALLIGEVADLAED